MRRLIVVPILALALGGPAANAIVNGKTVTPAQFNRDYPWIVALLSPGNGQICGATVVSPTFLVTTAHCASKGLAVLSSSSDRRKSVRLAVAETIVHPRFDSSTPGQFDVALLRLEKPLAIPSPHVPDEQESLEFLRKGGHATIMGWGVQPGSGKFADELAVADVRLTRIELHGTLILTEDTHAGVCSGDSGGPLIVKDARGRPVLIGIATVTAGNLCAKGGGIAGYTNVGQLRAFIRDNVPDLPPAPPPPRGPKP